MEASCHRTVHSWITPDHALLFFSLSPPFANTRLLRFGTLRLVFNHGSARWLLHCLKKTQKSG